MKYKIFVSGNQKELRLERFAVKEVVTGNAALRNLFDVFLFEDLPAKGKPPVKTYLRQVDNSEILIVIVGKEYGIEGKDGLSATEREFRRFRKIKPKGEIIAFIKGDNKEDVKRDKDTQVFVKTIKNSLIYKRFTSVDELKIQILHSLISYLDEKGGIPAEPFDQLLCKEADYGDIDEKEVRNFLENRAIKLKVEIPRISIKDFLIKTLGVVKKSNGKPCPTNAALLFFGKNPSVHIPQNEIRIARFKGTARIEFIDSQEIKGPIYKILEQVEIFFKRNTRLANKIVEFKRVDIPEYPYEAIREGIINAIAHRDYFRRGAPIMVSIFDDRVEISSPGGLLPGLNINKLEGHHVSRNKKICEIFHETKDMEKFGTGISKMKKLMRDHGLSVPMFCEEGDFFVVKFYGPQDKILDLVSSIPQTRQTDLRELGLNERQIKALQRMVNDKELLTIKKYAGLFHMSDKTAKRDMAGLVKSGFVAKVGYKKGAYFKAK